MLFHGKGWPLESVGVGPSAWQAAANGVKNNKSEATTVKFGMVVLKANLVVSTVGNGSEVPTLIERGINQ